MNEIKYESVEYPSTPNTGLTDALRNCPPGKSFEWQCPVRDSIYSVARRLGIKVKVSGRDGTFRVWRLS